MFHVNLLVPCTLFQECLWRSRFFACMFAYMRVNGCSLVFMIVVDFDISAFVTCFPFALVYFVVRPKQSILLGFP